MGPNALLALQMAAQAIQLTQQIQVLLQGSSARGTDLTDEELDRVSHGYAGVKQNVDDWLATHRAKAANEAAGAPMVDEPQHTSEPPAGGAE